MVASLLVTSQSVITIKIWKRKMNDGPVIVMYLPFVFVRGVMSDKYFRGDRDTFHIPQYVASEPQYFTVCRIMGPFITGPGGGRACVGMPTTDWPDIVYTDVHTYIGRCRTPPRQQYQRWR